MLPQERIDYSAITARPPLSLPDGKRMAVWVIVNIEEWNPKETMPRTVLTPPAGGAPMPDIPNWAWHEYGNRVGFWRLLKTMDELSVTGVLAINGTAVETYAPISKAALDRGWEFIGHGYSQKNMQKVEDERDEEDSETAGNIHYAGLCMAVPISASAESSRSKLPSPLGKPKRIQPVS